MIESETRGVGEKDHSGNAGRISKVSISMLSLGQTTRFFNQGSNKPPDNGQGQSGNGSSTDIFGSSSGGRSSTETAEQEAAIRTIRSLPGAQLFASCVRPAKLELLLNSKRLLP
jgi:hypothetical protein